MITNNNNRRCHFYDYLIIITILLLLLIIIIRISDAQLRVNQLPPFMAKSTVTLTDFVKIEGNCPGNYLNSSQTDIYSCADDCRFDAACLGFTYNFATSGCYLKQSDCTEPSLTNPFVNFFKKIPLSISSSGGAAIAGAINNNASTCSPSQSEGVEFVVVFQENFADKPQFLPLEVYVAATYETDTTTVVLSTPRYPKYEPRVFRLAPGEVRLFTLPPDFRAIGTGKERKTVLIRADKPVSVFGYNKETYTNDAFLAFPTSSLGREYRVVVWGGGVNYNQLAVVAAEADTDVTLRLPQRMPDELPLLVTWEFQTYTNGQAFTMHLLQYEAIQIQSPARHDLTGTLVTATRKVAVYAGNVRTNIEPGLVSRDHVVDEMPPIQSWGTEFITVPFPGRTSGDYFKIVAAEDATRVRVRGLDPEWYNILWAGQWILLRIPSNICGYVTSDKPILVAQFSLSQQRLKEREGKGDPCMTVVPAVNQFKHQYIFSTTSYAGLTPNENYVHTVLVALPTDSLASDFVVDDVNQAGDRWSQVQGNGGYSCGYIRVAPGRHRLIHTTKVPFMAIVYGYADRESYAYPAGMDLHANGESTCTICPQQRPCDTIDNDCDNKAEEELCDGIDDDGDGRVDEDCCGTAPMTPVKKDIFETKICTGRFDTLVCPAGLRIKVVAAHYGRVCYAGERACNCSNPIDEMGVEMRCPYENVLATVSLLCDFKASCNVTASRQLFTSLCASRTSRCPPELLYLDVFWACLMPAELMCSEMTESDVHSYAASSHLSGQRYEAPACRRKATSHLLYDMLYDGDYCEQQLALFDRYSPDQARLGAAAGRIWCAAECDGDMPFVQIDLGGHYLVKGVVIQGHRQLDRFVTLIAIQNSNDGRKWRTIFDPASGVVKHFDASADTAQVVWWDLGGWAFTARYVRIYAIAASEHACMHVAVVHCNERIACPPLLAPNIEQRGLRGVPASRLQVRCLPGFVTPTYARDFSVECTEEGKWRLDAQAACNVAVDCGDIVQLPNAVYDARSNKVGFTTRYFCLQGSTLIGRSVSTCQQNGQWSLPPICCNTDEMLPGRLTACVQLSVDAVTYDEAKAECRRRGGRLAEPNSLAELSIVANLVGLKRISGWIGVTDRAKEGAWLTESMGTLPTYQLDWAPGQPNGVGVANCVIASAQSFGRLDDVSCDEAHRYFCYIEHNATAAALQAVAPAPEVFPLPHQLMPQVQTRFTANVI